MLTFHSFRASGSTYSRLHHRLPKSFNADAISSLHFFKSIREGNLYIYRLYQNLVASDPESKHFKRRLTWVESVPTTMPHVPANVAVVEYIGTFPLRLLHGNAKNKETNSVYIRTKDSVLTHLKSQHDIMKAVELHMNTTTKDDFLKQRNDKQLENLKYQINRSQKSATETNNAADHVISVEKMTKMKNQK